MILRWFIHHFVPTIFGYGLVEATEALVERYRKGWEEAQSEAKRLMSQRGADLEKLGAPRWSWAVHSVLARTKESRFCNDWSGESCFRFSWGVSRANFVAKSPLAGVVPSYFCLVFFRRSWEVLRKVLLVISSHRRTRNVCRTSPTTRTILTCAAGSCFTRCRWVENTPWASPRRCLGCICLPSLLQRFVCCGLFVIMWQFPNLG